MSNTSTVCATFNLAIATRRPRLPHPTEEVSNETTVTHVAVLLSATRDSRASFAQSQDVITESDVLALMNSVDKAARKKNLAGMIAPLASDVKIKLAVSASGSEKEQVVNLNKEQYTNVTKRTLRQRSTYTHPPFQ